MPDHSSTSSDLSQDDLYDAVPPLPTNRYHLEQLLRDVSKVIGTGEELLASHRYERHVMEEDVLAWRKNYCSMAYTRRLQENDLLKWRVENGLQEWQENSERPVAANLGDAPDNSSPQPIKDICSYLYHTQETAAAAKELDDIGQQCKQLPQLQTFSDPEDLEEFINLGKRITELWYECDMKRLHVLRERIWRQLEPPEQEANPQSSRDVPVDDCHWDGEKIERVKKFQNI